MPFSASNRYSGSSFDMVLGISVLKLKNYTKPVMHMQVQIRYHVIYEMSARFFFFSNERKIHLKTKQNFDKNGLVKKYVFV